MTVVKVGGEIVSGRDLHSAVDRLRARFGAELVFIAGGGESANLVRKWDGELGLGDADAHWLAIRAMSLQAELLARRLALPLSPSFASCRLECVFDLWLELSRSPDQLPIGWHVTSDSLAAWAAGRLNARRLVLVKSVGDHSTSLDAAAERRWVDPYFSNAAAGLHVDWFNPAEFS